MFNLIEVGLQTQAASIGAYYRICNQNETTGELLKDAHAHGAILQQRGNKQIISTVLHQGFKRVPISYIPDSPSEAA